jgi:hypothetical protein
MIGLLCFVVAVLASPFKSKIRLEAENATLRHQLVLRRKLKGRAHSKILRDTLRPGDVLLVEGKGHISGSIKYLTQSTWSHSALYVGGRWRAPQPTASPTS